MTNGPHHWGNGPQPRKKGLVDRFLDWAAKANQGNPDGKGSSNPKKKSKKR